MLDKVLRRSDVVDKESLCIIAGQRVRLQLHDLYYSLFSDRQTQVWHLRLTLHFLSDAGNMLDCACLAGIMALKHFRRPEVEVVGDEVTVVCYSFFLPPSTTVYIYKSAFPQHDPSERAPLPLAIHHTPFCFTFAFFPDPAIPPVLDPSQLEQRLSAGLLSIALNAQRELCVLQKLGGVPLPMDDIMKIVDIAVQKAKELNTIADARLKEDWASRKVEVR